MIDLTLFRVLQCAVIILFIILISDIRKKNQSSPLIDQRFVIALKVSYLAPILIYTYILFTLTIITYLDIIALLVTSIGTIIAVVAKLTLSNMHTWTGYCLDSASCFVARGIYSYIRHPLYLGIYLFIFGGAITLVPNSSLLLNAVVFAYLLYIMSFLAISAHKETNYLSQKLGTPYIRYKNQVHAFLPLRRYDSE